MSEEEILAWWATDLSHISPGVITLRGRPIQDLIGSVSFVQVLWLLLRGDMPRPREAALLEAALVAGVDHGTQAPSIASARMAATCGVGLNNAIANGVNVLGDVHGGAGQQCVELLLRIDERRAAVDNLVQAVEHELAQLRYVPGFGHRFHPVDPRREPLLRQVEEATRDGTVPGHHLEAAREIEKQLNDGRDRPVPMNIDGATAVIYAELGFPAPLARGFFVLSRSVGILAHAWEETQQGRRIKGPLPPRFNP
ncbi:MAG TPA: citryl-CoA lyase [Candidatus Limnocylindrales bacterium]|nr:citryl-CoA lyase [Candidatus Limnocylindrales bacterium]